MNKRPKFIINGRFLTQRLTGTQRYSLEMTRELDKLSNGDIVLAIPSNQEILMDIPKFKAIKIKKFGKFKGNLWDQISLPLYAKKHKLQIISLNNTVPILSPDIATIHDMTYVKHKEFHSTKYGKISALLHSVQFSAAAKHAIFIITSSINSKKEIIGEYGINEKRVVVLGCGWEHIMNVSPDYSIISRSNLDGKNFIFTLGSIEQNKNIKWISEMAKRNQGYTFVISGGVAKNHTEEINPLGLSNIVFTGYLTDEEIVALYKKCYAFAFPSVYEGFGIPPLEARALGCEVMCARASCLPEIYSTYVHWFEPYDYSVSIEEIMAQSVDSADNLLDKYSWKRMAQLLYNHLKKI